MNGFRIGYLYKMFPDAKFVHIARNPIKTCKSQLLLQESNCRAYWVEPQKIRKQSMKFHFAKHHLKNPKDSTGYVTHNQVPNDTVGNLWYPRVFPRTMPGLFFPFFMCLFLFFAFALLAILFLLFCIILAQNLR